MPSKVQRVANQKYDAADVIPYNRETEADEILHPKCKLCNSKFRHIAEEKLEATHNYTVVAKLLKDKGEHISMNAIRNHMAYHYERMKNITLQQGGYADDIASWMNFDSNPENSLKRGIAVLEREMHHLAAFADTLPHDDRLKTSEQVRRTADTLLSYKKHLTELHKEIEPVQFIFQQLTIIIKDKIKNKSDDLEFKEDMVDVLQQLQAKTGDLVVTAKS